MKINYLRVTILNWKKKYIILIFFLQKTKTSKENRQFTSVPVNRCGRGIAVTTLKKWRCFSRLSVNRHVFLLTQKFLKFLQHHLFPLHWIFIPENNPYFLFTKFPFCNKILIRKHYTNNFFLKYLCMFFTVQIYIFFQ